MREDLITPYDFGALGNGKHDDGPAIQAAIDAAIARQKMVLLPFDSVTNCQKCGGAVVGFDVKFSTSHVVDAGSGRFISIQTQCDSFIPHLEKHCPHCGFGWLEQTKDEMSL